MAATRCLPARRSSPAISISTAPSAPDSRRRAEPHQTRLPRFCRFSRAGKRGKNRARDALQRDSPLLLFKQGKGREYDPYKLASPQIYLWRMSIFLIIAAFIALILYRQVINAFEANPGLNAVIIAVLLIGIALAFRQIFRLFPEIRWGNTFRVAEPGIEVERPPVLLAPLATLLGDRIGRMAISTHTMRSILDSIQMRLDEDRELGRYLTSLLIFLGLLGTFWGLLQTVAAVASTIQNLDVSSSNTGVIFEDLKAGLAAPLQGMGVAFSSSLFGLAGSLILGFLDLQAGQGQNMFYNDLEDWLSTVTDLDPEMLESRGGATTAEDLRVAIERLSRTIQEGRGGD